MHPRMIRRVALLAAALFLAAAAVGACASSTDTGSSSGGYPARDASAGGIDVTATPVRIDSTGASIEIAFNSHVASFDADPTTAITLDVNGTRWPASGWDGDAATGHHRKGTLRFTPSGPATGTATLTIGELPQPVTLTWTIGGT